MAFDFLYFKYVTCFISFTIFLLALYFHCFGLVNHVHLFARLFSIAKYQNFEKCIYEISRDFSYFLLEAIKLSNQIILFSVFQIDKQEFGLKPMNCSGHCLMFKHKVRSYRGNFIGINKCLQIASFILVLGVAELVQSLLLNSG